MPENPSKAERLESEEEFIFGTTITWNLVEKELIKAFKTTATFGNNKRVQRIGVGQGFLSIIGRLYPDWTPNNNEQLPSSVILKIPTLATSKEVLANPKVQDKINTTELKPERMIEKMQTILHQAHNTEVSFYELVKENNINVKIPKTFYLKKFTDPLSQGLIILEDAGEDSSITSPSEIVTFEEVLQVVDTLTEVHSFSLQNPECIKIGSTSLSTIMNDEIQINMFLSFLKYLRISDPDGLGPLIDEIENNWSEIFDSTIVEKLHNQMGIPPVLVHGDLWTSNIVWKKQQNGRQLAAILDWQIIHAGCAAEDIARLMGTGMSGRDRREYEDKILEHYYQTLTHKLGHNPPFTYDQLKESFIRLSPFALSLILPTFGPLAQLEVEEKHPDKKEELFSILKEKTQAIVEDILRSYKINKGIAKN